ncbi:MAG: MFS transporter, partial [Cyanobacteria bacterium]|nr:MFS transporter [Cyanobacteriota bacterium]
GGLLSPMTQMMIARAAGKHMAKVMGFAAMPVLVAPLFGPMVAGAILKYASWPWLFFINLPVGIFAIILAAILLPADELSPIRRSFDWQGFLLISPAMVALLYGLEHFLSLNGQLCLLAGSVMLAAFVRHSFRRGNQALLDLQLFRVKDFSTAAITLFLHTGGMLAGQMLIPLYLTVGCHMPPASAGALVAIMGIGMLCSYPFVGILVERFGARRVAVSGALLLALSTIPILWMANSHLTAVGMMASLIIRGIGQSAIGIPSVSSGYSKIPRERLPQATTASNIVQRLGGPVATTIMAIVLSVSVSQVHQTDDHSYVIPFTALIFWQILLLCAAMRLPSKERSPQLTGN